MNYGKKFSLLFNISFNNDLVNNFEFTFMLREPIDLPPIVSVELIQISELAFLSFPKARKILEETKKRKKE